MRFPEYFADAESSFTEAEFVVFGVPYDKTSSFRFGSVKGPQEIRQASWNIETFDLRTGIDIRQFKMHDYGNLPVEKKQPAEMVSQVKTFVSSIVKGKKFPVGLGGEHAITPGILQAFPKDTAVVSLDAHLDFRKEYEHETWNHACVIRRLCDHLDIHNIAVLGIRSADKEEYEDARKLGLFFKDAYAIRDESLKNILQQTQHHLKGKPIYLTLDIDVVDPAYAPGVSTPEPFGLTPWEVCQCLEFFAPHLVGFDLVEVCPPFDHGQTAMLAARLARLLICSVGARA